MSKCEKCGRNGGHWIGCAEAITITLLLAPLRTEAPPPPGAEMCAYGECVFQRRPKTGKGPAPKFCETHSDPKNRK